MTIHPLKGALAASSCPLSITPRQRPITIPYSLCTTQHHISQRNQTFGLVLPSSWTSSAVDSCVDLSLLASGWPSAAGKLSVGASGSWEASSSGFVLVPDSCVSSDSCTGGKYFLSSRLAFRLPTPNPQSGQDMEGMREPPTVKFCNKRPRPSPRNCRR
jgi:hypothetical protein